VIAINKEKEINPGVRVISALNGRCFARESAGKVPKIVPFWLKSRSAFAKSPRKVKKYQQN
jgi:hypothetical protein